MSMARTISRRTVLRGMGAAIALPWLEAMTPRVARAGQAIGPPRRMAFVYVPNGIYMPDFTPAAVGAEFELPWLLEPLAPFKSEMTVLSGLCQYHGWSNGDGAGDHARSMATFLTASHVRKTGGADISAGVSVDQIAAEKVGRGTKFPSIEIGCERGARSGLCDSGYSCAYSANLSWRTESTPMAKEINPRLLFERLFGNGLAGEAAESRLQRDRYQSSILDYVLEDARSLRAQLGTRDRRKLDEYLSAVRDIEARIGRVSTGGEKLAGGMEIPSGIPSDYATHIHLMSDLLVLALQGDLTRVATFVLSIEGSNRPYPFIDVPEGHHELSHHGNDKEKVEKIRKINRFHTEQLAYLIERLKSVSEADGSLLDNCMVVYGSGLSDGNRHSHDDLPIVMFGRGGGTIKAGRHVQVERKTPLANLYVSMLDRLDARVDTIGDSRGRVALE